jgi:hypothetical protein
LPLETVLFEDFDDFVVGFLVSTGLFEVEAVLQDLFDVDFPRF